MERSGNIIFCCVTLLIAGVAGSNCTNEPGPPENGTELFVWAASEAGWYEPGEVALFECVDIGYGVIFMRCLGNNTWTEPNRSCEDAVPVEPGSMVAMGFVVLALVLTVTAIAMSYMVVPESKEDMTELTSQATFKESQYRAPQEPQDPQSPSSMGSDPKDPKPISTEEDAAFSAQTSETRVEEDFTTQHSFLPLVETTGETSGNHSNNNRNTLVLENVDDDGATA